ncbi:MAG TPA: hypothetical protein VF630_04000 [Hymenobacter sp.]
MPIKSFLDSKESSEHKLTWLLFALIAIGLLVFGEVLPAILADLNYYWFARGESGFDQYGTFAMSLGLGIQLMIQIAVFLLITRRVPRTKIFNNTLWLILIISHVLALLSSITLALGIIFF